MGGESAVNCLNGHGSTPLDCLELCHKDYNSLQIRDILVQAGGGGRSQQDHPTAGSSHSNLVPLPSKEAPVPARKRRKNKSCCKSMGRKLKNFLAYEGNWLEKMKKTVLLVATIIASMSFQAATNPPGGVWSENRMSPVYGALCNETNVCKSGTAILAYGDEARPELLDIFVACNTIAFGASLGIMLLIVGGFPIKKNKFFTWILTQAICTALTCMTLAFVFAGLLVIPDQTSVFAIACWSLFLGIWILLILVIEMLDTVRFMLWVCSKLRKIGKAMGGCCSKGEELV